MVLSDASFFFLLGDFFLPPRFEDRGVPLGVRALRLLELLPPVPARCDGERLLERLPPGFSLAILPSSSVGLLLRVRGGDGAPVASMRTEFRETSWPLASSHRRTSVSIVEKVQTQSFRARDRNYCMRWVFCFEALLKA